MKTKTTKTLNNNNNNGDGKLSNEIHSLKRSDCERLDGSVCDIALTGEQQFGSVY